jgi:hypothetical protein
MMELAKKQSPVVLAELLAGTLAAAKQVKADLTSCKRQVQVKTQELESSRHETRAKVQELHTTTMETRALQVKLAKQSLELTKFQSLVSSGDEHVIRKGSVTKESLPTEPPHHVHSVTGSNVYLDYRYHARPIPSYPLFYYKP